MSYKMVYANNKKAYFDYFIEDKYEAGIALVGTEVKGIKTKGCSIKESYIEIKNDEAYIIHMHIAPYEEGNIFNVDSFRTKKLLLHKQEINKLLAKQTEKGYTIVPTSVYEIDGKIKIEIALAKGKHNYDKRESLKAKAVKREIEKGIKYGI